MTGTKMCTAKKKLILIMNKKGPNIVFGSLFFLLCILFFYPLLLTETAHTSNLIPREMLFGNPEKINPQISPSGEKITYIAPFEGVMNIWIEKLDGSEKRVLTKDQDRGIFRYFWAYDSKHILYLQDQRGNENWHLYSINIDTESIKDLTPFEEVQARVIHLDKHFPNQILIALNLRNKSEHDVYHLDLSTGKIKLLEKNSEGIVGWIVDSNFRIRGKIKMNENGGKEFWMRKSADSEWEQKISWDLDDAMSSGVIGFNKDGDRIYLIDSRGSNTARLFSWNIKTNEYNVLGSDPDYDVSGVLINPDTYKIQMIGITKERHEWEVLDDSISSDIETIKTLYPGDFSIVSRDNADSKWILAFNSDKKPLSFFLFDRKTKKETFLFTHRPELQKFKLASQKSFCFIARDGLKINGYFTAPIDRDLHDLPTVILVHGGPWTRDTWGFDPVAQWLANRGFLCLQINFRGSVGYGKNLLNAGNREWGRKMHEDIVDAINWAEKKGWLDPKRIAIYGVSYGGYEALIGATKTPELFKCAVSVSGPVNLITLLESVPSYWKSYLANIYKRIGNPETEKEFLESRSPLFSAGKIENPIMLVQGANDIRVKPQEAEQMIEAMKEKDIDFRYLFFADEGHGLLKPGNRLKFFGEVEEFFAKHLADEELVQNE